MQAKEHETVTLEELKAQIEAMRTAYEAEIAALRDDKEAELREASAKSEKFKKFLREQEAWLNEYVEVRLFKDNEKYKMPKC